MNPQRVKDFLTSKVGLFLIFVGLVASGLLMFDRNQPEQGLPNRVPAPKGKNAPVGQFKAPLNQGLEDGTPQPTGDQPLAHADVANSEGRIIPFRPAPPPTAAGPLPIAAKAGTVKAVEKSKRIHFSSLLMGYEAPVATAPLESRLQHFLPYGTLLKCKLVNTVDSSNVETPIIALLLEDAWQNGERVIPANTLLHGTGHAGRIRDRINASGTWRFVWQDGRELGFSGVALDREYDHAIDGYGITDGSAGIKGRQITADDLQEMKLLASAALSGFARGTQDRAQTAFGTTLTGSLSNGVREGVGQVFDLYAQRTLQDIERNGYFVRVAAGKEFYVYLLETVDPDKAKIGGEPIEKEKLNALPVSAAVQPAKNKG